MFIYCKYAIQLYKLSRISFLLFSKGYNFTTQPPHKLILSGFFTLTGTPDLNDFDVENVLVEIKSSH